jgi:hypothetical protein
MHIQWDTGIPGETYMRNCPTGYTGILCLAFEDRCFVIKNKETVL